MEKVNVAEKFDLFNDYWSPRIAAELNDSYIKLAKMKGEFVWHHHENEDELFFVTTGRLVIKLGEVGGSYRSWRIRGPPPPRVDRLPMAEDQIHVILIEPKTTLNTGNVVRHKTVTDLGKI